MTGEALHGVTLYHGGTAPRTRNPDGLQTMIISLSMTRKTIHRHFGFLVIGALCGLPAAFAQNRAIDFKPGAPFSDGYVAGNTLYVAGQQGPDGPGKFGDISQQTTKAIAAIEKIVKKAGFQMADITSVTVYITDLNDVPKMNDVYKKLMPDPKPARATVQVAGLIG